MTHIYLYYGLVIVRLSILIFCISSIGESDYAVNNNAVRFITAVSTSVNLPVSFHVDSVAQEPDETLTITLDESTSIPSGNGVFFRNTTELTIIDSDGKLQLAVLINGMLELLVNWHI